MKSNCCSKFFLCILGLLVTTTAFGANFSKFTSSSEMCWLETVTRGVGTIPDSCPANYKSVLGVCWQQACPAGYRDDGLFCRKAEYGRGGGYALWDEGKCNRENKQGCEKNGLMWYPKCAPGYTNFGCCICRPVSTTCPDGMVEVLGSCAKKTQAASCPAGKAMDAGLCYNACPADTKGVGPVCWGQCPKSKPFKCAAGCTKDEDACIRATTEQVLSVALAAVKTAAIVASFGTATPAVVAGSSAVGIAQDQVTKAVDDKKAEAKKTALEQLRKQAQKVKEMAAKQGKDAREGVVSAVKEKAGEFTGPGGAGKAAEQLGDMVKSPETFDFSSLDPVGITQIIKSFNKPICKEGPEEPAEEVSEEDLVE